MNNTDVDLIIIGAGTAGLTAAQYGARANLSVLVLEQMASGGQALLIDVLENYPGIATGKTGYEFSEDLHNQAKSFGATFQMEQVQSIGKEGEVFAVKLSNGQVCRSLALILATGAKHRTLDVPGEATFAGKGVSYCATCDGPFFRNKKIFVVGGGDAACDEAQYLANLTKQVVLVHRREKFRAQKALAERVIRNPNIDVRFNTVIQEIKGASETPAGKVTSVVLAGTSSSGGKVSEESADAVFVCTGMIPQTALVSGDFRAETDEAGYIVTDARMATSIPGLFAAGDVRTTPFRQVITAASDGAIAAHCASAYIDELKGTAYR